MPKTISRFIYEVVLGISNVLLGATGWLVDFLLDQKGLTTLVTTQNLSLSTELWRANLAHTTATFMPTALNIGVRMGVGASLGALYSTRELARGSDQQKMG